MRDFTGYENGLAFLLTARLSRIAIIVKSIWCRTPNKLQENVFLLIIVHFGIQKNISKVGQNRFTGKGEKMSLNKMAAKNPLRSVVSVLVFAFDHFHVNKNVIMILLEHYVSSPYTDFIFVQILNISIASFLRHKSVIVWLHRFTFCLSSVNFCLLSLVGRLCVTFKRQQGHLDRALPYTVPCEGRQARF